MQDIRDINSAFIPISAKTDNFPQKLHRILSNPKYRNVITWLPHGRSWKVLEPKILEDKVIPLYFRHRNFLSFMRQVNGWGFRRVNQGADRNSYYHEDFLRGLAHLCTRMQRPKKAINQSHQDPHQSSAVPDFYAASKAHPLPDEYTPPDLINDDYVLPLTTKDGMKRKLNEYLGASNIFSPLNMCAALNARDRMHMNLGNYASIIGPHRSVVSNSYYPRSQPPRDLFVKNENEAPRASNCSLFENSVEISSQKKLRILQAQIAAMKRELLLLSQPRDQLAHSFTLTARMHANCNPSLMGAVPLHHGSCLLNLNGHLAITQNGNID